jgi:phage protein U
MAMAVVGNLGNLITFEVSSDKVLTFDKMKRTVKGRWATHDAIGGKTKSEFLGAGNASIALPIFLSSMHGVRPRVTLERIADAVERGEYYPLVIGGRSVGRNKWRITSASETWDTIIRDGILVEANVTLNLEEYV